MKDEKKGTSGKGNDQQEDGPRSKRQRPDGNEAGGGGDRDAGNNERSKSKRVKARMARKATRKKNVNPAVYGVRHAVQMCCRDVDLAGALEVFDRSIGGDARAADEEDGGGGEEEGEKGGEKVRLLEPQTCYNLLALCDRAGDDDDDEEVPRRRLHVGTPRPAASSPPASFKGGGGGGGKEADASHGDDASAATERTANEGAKRDEGEAGRRKFTAEERLRHALRIRRHMDESGVPLNEAAYTSLVRVASSAGDTEMAEKIRAEAESDGAKPKLRTYSALLMAHARGGDLGGVLRTWERAEGHGLALTEREYCAAMRCATASGDAEVFVRVLAELADTVLVPSHGTIDAIAAWFASPHAVAESSSSSPSSSILSSVSLGETDAPSLGPVVASAPGASWTIDRGCSIDSSTGILETGCLEGDRLRPMTLRESDRLDMIRMNESIVTSPDGSGLREHQSPYQGGRKGPKRKRSADELSKRIEAWGAFKAWLGEQRQRSGGGGFDVVVDGANVGYYKMNFAGAPKHVDYRQIDWVARRLAATGDGGRRVLVVLHERHFHPRMMPQWAGPIVRGWEEGGGRGGEGGGVGGGVGGGGSVALYRTPAGCNDDWFWLHAALTSINGGSGGDGDGDGGGGGCMVVTNDEMRDHHFQMLAPRSFLRWRERRRIRFAFGGWGGSGPGPGPGPGGRDAGVAPDGDGGWQRQGQRQGRDREVILTYPDAYSRRVQRTENGIAVPLPRRGDENRFLDGVHVAAEDEPEEETYMCIRCATVGGVRGRGRERGSA